MISTQPCGGVNPPAPETTVPEPATALWRIGTV